jgi:hypothetical protein
MQFPITDATTCSMQRSLLCTRWGWAQREGYVYSAVATRPRNWSYTITAPISLKCDAINDSRVGSNRACYRRPMIFTTIEAYTVHDLLPRMISTLSELRLQDTLYVSTPRQRHRLNHSLWRTIKFLPNVNNRSGSSTTTKQPKAITIQNKTATSKTAGNASVDVATNANVMDTKSCLEEVQDNESNNVPPVQLTDPPILTWFDAIVPTSLIPYTRLARLDKPIGTMLLVSPLLLQQHKRLVTKQNRRFF